MPRLLAYSDVREKNSTDRVGKKGGVSGGWEGDVGDGTLIGGLRGRRLIEQGF